MLGGDHDLQVRSGGAMQRLPNPSPTPTSQQAGTTSSNADAMTAPGTAPGPDSPPSDHVAVADSGDRA